MYIDNTLSQKVGSPLTPQSRCWKYNAADRSVRIGEITMLVGLYGEVPKNAVALLLWSVIGGADVRPAWVSLEANGLICTFSVYVHTKLSCLIVYA